jgi:hypothetical protein
MSDMNGIGPLVDLGEVQRRQKEKEQVPSYSVGSPDLALQVGLQLNNGQLSFRDALDKAAILLDQDGFTIEEVKHCGFAGMGQQGEAVFQIVVRVSDTETPY